MHGICNRYAFGTDKSDLIAVAVLLTTSFVATNGCATITSSYLSGRVLERYVMSSGDHTFG